MNQGVPCSESNELKSQIFIRLPSYPQELLCGLKPRLQRTSGRCWWKLFNYDWDGDQTVSQQAHSFISLTWSCKGECQKWQWIDSWSPIHLLLGVIVRRPRTIIIHYVETKPQTTENHSHKRRNGVTVEFLSPLNPHLDPPTYVLKARKNPDNSCPSCFPFVLLPMILQYGDK